MATKKLSGRRMRRGAYYNERDRFLREWLRNLMKRGLIEEGEVDERPSLCENSNAF
jgi:hypothetical protein